MASLYTVTETTRNNQMMVVANGRKLESTSNYLEDSQWHMKLGSTREQETPFGIIFHRVRIRVDIECRKAISVSNPTGHFNDG